jgi:hypothetical protein
MGKKPKETETDTGLLEPTTLGEAVSETPPPETPPVEEPDELTTLRAEADGQRAALEAERGKRQNAEAELEQLRAAETALAAETEVTGVLDGLEAKPVEEQLAAAVEALRDMTGRVEQLEGDARTNIIRSQYSGYEEARKEAGFEPSTEEDRRLDVAYLKERGMPSLAEAFYSRNREDILDKARAKGEKAGLEARNLNKETGSEGVSGTAPPAEAMTPAQKEAHEAMLRRAKAQGNVPRDFGKKK